MHTIEDGSALTCYQGDSFLYLALVNVLVMRRFGYRVSILRTKSVTPPHKTQINLKRRSDYDAWCAREAWPEPPKRPSTSAAAHAYDELRRRMRSTRPHGTKGRVPLRLCAFKYLPRRAPKQNMNQMARTINDFDIAGLGDEVILNQLMAAPFTDR
eukprot:2221303-Pleurochrysis_carterae.AAC.1